MRCYDNATPTIVCAVRPLMNCRVAALTRIGDAVLRTAATGNNTAFAACRARRLGRDLAPARLLQGLQRVLQELLDVLGA
jgi:hypothetical protein